MKFGFGDYVHLTKLSDVIMLPTKAPPASQAALRTVARGLQSVNQGGALTEGRQSRTGGLFSRIWAMLCDIRYGTSKSDISHESLANSADGFYQQVLQSKLNDVGHFEETSIAAPYSKNITFKVEDHQFVLQESVDIHGHYALHFSEGADSIFTSSLDSDKGGTKIMKGMNIAGFKVACLKKYIDQHRVVWQAVDLSQFDFNGLNLSGVDFSGTAISVNNMRAIAAHGGNLAGASFVENTVLMPEDIHLFQQAGGRTVEGAVLSETRPGPRQIGAKDLKLDNLRIDKNMAHALIKDGADPTKVFRRYIETARAQGNVPIDVSGFSLGRMVLKDVNLKGVESSHVLGPREDNIFYKAWLARGASEEPISSRLYKELRMEMDRQHKQGLVTKSDDLTGITPTGLHTSYFYTPAVGDLDKAILEDVQAFNKLAGRTERDADESPRVVPKKVELSGKSAKPIGKSKNTGHNQYVKVEQRDMFVPATGRQFITRGHSSLPPRDMAARYRAEFAVKPAKASHLRQQFAAMKPAPRPVRSESTRPAAPATPRIADVSAAKPAATRTMAPVKVVSTKVDGGAPKSTRPVAPPTLGSDDPLFKEMNGKNPARRFIIS